MIEHLKHRKKYLPIHLNGRLCKACADFGAAANIIEATLARELNLEIILDEYCLPFELPTFNKLIKPVGRTKIRCEFPDEPDTHKEYDFFVFENLVFPAIVGRHFLRDTKTFDVFRKRLYERPVQVHDVPIVAFLGVEKESLKCWLDGEELASTPDIGSEINAMSLEFARKRKFVIEEDPIHQVCFADGSVQDVEGRISVPVSFGNGAPPSLLLKQVDLSPNSGGELQTRSCDADGKIDYGSTAPILVDFHILSGLNVDIIFGEDLLATVNTFVRHSTDFNDVVNPTSLYPGLAAMGPVSKVARPIYEAIGKRGPQTVVPLGEQDIAGSKGLDRYKREVERIKGLGGEERRRAQRRNERKRREYNERRSRT